MLDFSPPLQTTARAAQVRRFIDDVVPPREPDVAAELGRLETIRAELQQAARALIRAGRAPADTAAALAQAVRGKLDVANPRYLAGFEPV